MNIADSSEAGILKIMLFPDKIQRILSDDIDLSYPISVELSLTSRCNASCIWCGDAKLRKNSPSDLSYETACNLFTDLSTGGTRGLVIEGGGEPLLHPEFKNIVEASAQSGLKLGLITNGTVRLPKDIINKFSWIRISLDAANREQYLRIKGNDLFDNVMNNIKYIATNKISTIVGVGYVVSSINASIDGFLPQIIEKLKEYGISYIQFRPVVDHPDLATHIDLSFLTQYSSIDFKVDVGALTSNQATGNGGTPCIAHSLSSVINSDGNVYLCGRLNIHDWISPVGNIYQTNFKEIWTGSERFKQIHQISNRLFCEKHCPPCRLTKYNQLLHSMNAIKTKDFI